MHNNEAERITSKKISLLFIYEKTVTVSSTSYCVLLKASDVVNSLKLTVIKKDS